MSYVTDKHFDLALIQESWVRKCDSSILTEIKEYKCNVATFRKPANLEWGGGVATIYKSNLKLSIKLLSILHAGLRQKVDRLL